MSKVTFDMSVSLDGFIAGPGDDVERLHEWLYDLASFRERHGRKGGVTGADAEILEEAFASVGAVIMGRRMFDVGENPWGDDPPFHNPVYVVSHEAREPLVKEGGTSFTFVGDGIESALEQARSAAGDADVSIAGGADVIRQYLDAGQVDEFQLHLVPVLLGGGVRLFDRPVELERTRLVDSPGVTHLRFRVAG